MTRVMCLMMAVVVGLAGCVSADHAVHADLEASELLSQAVSEPQASVRQRSLLATTAKAPVYANCIRPLTSNSNKYRVTITVKTSSYPNWTKAANVLRRTLHADFPAKRGPRAWATVGVRRPVITQPAGQKKGGATTKWVFDVAVYLKNCPKTKAQLTAKEALRKDILNKIVKLKATGFISVTYKKLQ